MTKVLWLAFNAKFSHTSLTVRYLRQAAAEIGINSDILELTINNYIPDIISEIYEHRPDILGICCYIWNIELVKKTIPLLRKILPETIIICGGPEVSYETDIFMQENPAVDFVVRGEGEETIKELLETLVIKRAITTDRILLQIPQSQGIAYRGADGTVTEGDVVAVTSKGAPATLRLPFPYTEMEMADIKEKILYYETSRGCPFSCAYCLSSATKGVRLRLFSEVKKELNFFVKHNVRQLKFVDRTFNANKAHYMQILCYIKDLPDSCRTNFHFEVAADYLDGETVQLFQELPRGRVQLEIGIQTTNPSVLKRIGRVNHWKDICRNIKSLQKNNNIHIHTDLIVGLPGEDIKSFGKSFNDLYALHTDMLQIGFLKFLKGSAMMDMVERFDYKYMDIGPYEVLSNNVMSYAQIRRLHILEQVFELYYNGGRCLKTTDYIIEKYYAGNAFKFYSAFSGYWERRCYHHRAHSVRNLYGYLWEFFKEIAGEGENQAICIVDNFLRFDALTADGGQNRPEFLNWNNESYREQTGRFWRDKLPSGKGATAVIEGFKFTNWRDLNKKYHIEFFDMDMSVNNGNYYLAKEKYPVLFSYKNNVYDGFIDIRYSF